MTMLSGAAIAIATAAHLFAAGPGPAPAPAAGAPAVSQAKSPIAVLPFRNLGGDPGLDWLGSGIAETMISDLRKSGKVTLVERGQVAVVLHEVLARQPKGEEDAIGVRVGRLVGARTVVVGGYQQAGKQLRINARFVDVETGVILDSVKATGMMESPFAVQDQVVDKLLGTPPKAIAARPPRKASPKSVEAYRLYAMATVALSDAEQRSYLKKAMELDPDFVYAGEALEALADRLSAYEKRALTALDERHRSMRAKLADPATPEPERVQFALALMTELIQRRRFAVAAEEAKRVYDMTFTPSLNMDPHEWASHNLVLAYKQLKREDIAMQYAERHLQEFPAGPSFTSVDIMAKDILGRRQRVPGELAEREARHAEIDNDIAEASRGASPQAPEFLAMKESGKCVWGRYTIIPLEVEADCRAFLEKYRSSAVPGAVLLGARYHRALALYELGRFEEAKAEIAAIEKDAPAFAAERNVSLATSWWALP